METSMEQSVNQVLTRARAVERAMHGRDEVWSIAPMGANDDPVPCDIEVTESFVRWRSSEPWKATEDCEVAFYGLYADGDLVLVDRIHAGPLRLIAGDVVNLTWTLRVVRHARR